MRLPRRTRDSSERKRRRDPPLPRPLGDFRHYPLSPHSFFTLIFFCCQKPDELTKFILLILNFSSSAPNQPPAGLS
jgi:hypothetical protein